MAVYYNEFDPFAAAWLKELMADGLIAKGTVDDRSIVDVRPKDLEGFTQCHFFAGIGGWSAAARLAGWDDDRPMWTGSPPCQPFSVAGNRKGQDDLRHLWPVFFSLIRKCRPPVVFGEQVSAAIKTGWFDDLQVDLEKEGYATAMVVLPACSIGAPHKRERLWTVAERMANPNNSGLEGFGGFERVNDKKRRQDTFGQHTEDSLRVSRWGNSRDMVCQDGKTRPIPIEPALFPLAARLPNRMGLLRGAGNAIVPALGAEIIKAFINHKGDENGI